MCNKAHVRVLWLGISNNPPQGAARFAWGWQLMTDQVGRGQSTGHFWVPIRSLDLTPNAVGTR